jgi:hypothetical protein
VHRNVYLSVTGNTEGQLTKPLVKRTLRGLVDKASNYQPPAVKSQTLGKASTPFSVFAARWQEEVKLWNFCHDFAYRKSSNIVF